MTLPDTPEDQRRELWDQLADGPLVYEAACMDCGWVYGVTRTMRPFNPAARGPVRWEVLWLPCGEGHSFGQWVPEMETVTVESIGPRTPTLGPLNASEEA